LRCGFFCDVWLKKKQGKKRRSSSWAVVSIAILFFWFSVFCIRPPALPSLPFCFCVRFKSPLIPTTFFVFLRYLSFSAEVVLVRLAPFALSSSSFRIYFVKCTSHKKHPNVNKNRSEPATAEKRGKRKTRKGNRRKSTWERERKEKSWGVLFVVFIGCFWWDKKSTR
jgi:hypothetical protein